MRKSCGDHYNIACPHCGKINHYVTQGIKIELSKIVCFKRQCFYCNEIIYYQARYEIVIEAFSEDPLD